MGLLQFPPEHFPDLNNWKHAILKGAFEASAKMDQTCMGKIHSNLLDTPGIAKNDLLFC